MSDKPMDLLRAVQLAIESGRDFHGLPLGHLREHLLRSFPAEHVTNLGNKIDDLERRLSAAQRDRQEIASMVQMACAHLFQKYIDSTPTLTLAMGEMRPQEIRSAKAALEMVKRQILDLDVSKYAAQQAGKGTGK